jgi:hypothetical protein
MVVRAPASGQECAIAQAMKRYVERAIRVASDRKGKDRHDDFARPTRVPVESLKPYKPRPGQRQPQQGPPDDRDNHFASADCSVHMPNADTPTGRIQPHTMPRDWNRRSLRAIHIRPVRDGKDRSEPPPKTPQNQRFQAFRRDRPTGDRGIEPRARVLETPMLPLHQSPRNA